jgi:hypothetical protein
MQWRRSTLGILLVSIAVGFEALLLHGETRPMTHPQPEHPAHFLSSDPAQAIDDECRYGKVTQRPHGPGCRRTAVVEADRSLWPDTDATGKLQRYGVLACDACAVNIQAHVQCNTELS